MASLDRQFTRRMLPRLTWVGLVPGLCCCLAGAGWAATAPRATGVTGGNVGAAEYQQAVEDFNRNDFDGASAILQKIPENGNSGQRADILNLHGAIYLHQHRFELARAFFARARTLDPGLWAASFNEAEAYFQQKNYAESRREFSSLLVQTPRADHPQEWALVQYKAFLASLLVGDEKPVQTFLSEHAKDAPPPAAYYFLNAAIEYRHTHEREAGQWLAQGAASYPPGAEEIYAETFSQLGWPTPHMQPAAALAESHGSVGTLDASSAKKSDVLSTMDAHSGAAQKLPPATLAVVQLIPGQNSDVRPPARQVTPIEEKPAFRFGGPMAIPLAPEQPSVQNLPPAPPDDLRYDPGMEGGMLIGGGPTAASLLARHRSQASPSPTAPASSPDATATASGSADGQGSPAGSASPGASAAASSASPAASPDAGAASPAASPAPAQPAFVQKYEAAYVKFIQKDYAGAKELLDEADAIQANQPSSISLRGPDFQVLLRGGLRRLPQGGLLRRARPIG